MRKSQSQFVKYYSILPADAPRIIQHPKDQSVATGADVSFHVEATGDNLTFQWQKNHSDLDDGERCCGTRTNRLRIIEVEMSDKGRYRCLVKNSVGDEFSQEAFLSKLVMCSSTLGSGLEKDEHVQTYGFDLRVNKSPWYLFCRTPYYNSWYFPANWPVSLPCGFPVSISTAPVQWKWLETSDI